jgi:hypothetical protein
MTTPPAFTPLFSAVMAGLISCAAVAQITPQIADKPADTPVDKAAPADDGPRFKLTTGFYGLSGADLPASRALDVNLRYATAAIGDLWLGTYRSPSLALTQTRAGWDNTYKVGATRFTPSLQTASGGFWGGSVNVETGDSLYVGVGFGRTNLRNYVNLNFDPNDAYMLSTGYRWQDARSLGLQLVRDNRQNPDQQHLHLVYRTPFAEHERLTLDALYKKGLVLGEPIRRVGLSATYDWPRYFARVAYDPKVNFTPQNMWRVQVGTRF